MTHTQRAVRMSKSRPRITFREGWIVVPNFSASGGVTYDRSTIREDLVDRGTATEFHTTKKVDDADLVRESIVLVGTAYYALRKCCVRTPIGYFADDSMLGQMQPLIEQAKLAARTFNELARARGSARRVTIEVYPLEMNLESAQAARCLARTVRERLAGLHTGLAAADRKVFETAWDSCRNLHMLATGIQSDSIRLAMEHAREEKGRLVAHLKEGGDASTFQPNLEPIEASMNLFTLPENFIYDEDLSSEIHQ